MNSSNPSSTAPRIVLLLATLLGWTAILGSPATATPFANAQEVADESNATDPTAVDPAEAVAAALQAVLNDKEQLAPFMAFYDEAMEAALPPISTEQILAAVRKKCGAPFEVVVDPEGWQPVGSGRYLRAIGTKSHAIFYIVFDSEDRIAGMRQTWEAQVWSEAELLARLEKWDGDWGIAGMRIEADGRFGGSLERKKGLEVFPLGSIFKVYVLAEFARQVARGELSWDDKLAVREAEKSLPSGIMQNDPAGTEHDLRRYVRQMIGLSDNTATDHLMVLLGREGLESRLPLYFNSVPEKNRPFLTTQEMFYLKSLKEARALYPKDLNSFADWWWQAEPEQRQMKLKTLRASLMDQEPAKIRQACTAGYSFSTMAALRHGLIEWHADPIDIVRLYAAARRDELIDAETSAHFRTGLGYGAPLYMGPNVSYQGFKGGNETGLMAFSVLVTLEDGTSAAVCVCRRGFPILDSNVLDYTSDVTTAFTRMLLEGRLGQ